MSCCIQCVTCDVPDDVVYTDLRKSVRIEDSVVLTCRFHGTPLAVYWKKGNDPRKAPNLVSWIPTDDVTGLCEGERPCQIMEMNENRSLVIKEVSIAEQGRYICRVSSYKGILIHNFTDVNVYAPPRKPYPIIEGCKANDSVTLRKNYGCVIPTHVGVNITCSASDFFPDLHLFFLHGSEKIAPLEIKKWTNGDGTRGKSVTVNVLPHDIPYVCVASDVPGDLEERAVTVFVSLIQQNDTLMGSTLQPHKPMNAVIIVVPIVFVTISGVCILLVCCRRHHRQNWKRRGQDEALPLLEQMTIKGKLSFYELWMMLSRVTTSDMEKLKDTFYELSIGNIVENSAPLEAYNHFCRWKTDNVRDDQADILKKALEKCKYVGAWEKIWGLRRSSAIAVSEGTLEHILLHIGEPGKIDKFLSELIPGRTTTSCEVTGGMSKFVQEPLRELMKWSVGTIDTNPMVLLSLALERAGYSPLDRTFFCVSDLPVSSDDVHHFVKKLASRHCSILTDLPLYKIESIVKENNHDLFDTESMISDWIARENGSHIDKRCKLDHAAISIGRYDLKGYLVGYGSHISMSETGEEEHTEHSKEARSKEGQGNDNLGNDLSDGELHRIIRYLDKEQLSDIIGEHAEGDSFNTIKAWIAKESTAGQPDSCRQRLRAQLCPIGMEDLIPLEIKEDVSLVELVDVAFRLIMTDIYPLAKALDISTDQLKSYKRQSPDKSKLSRGTIGVMVKLGEKTNFARSKLCDALARGAGWQEMAHLLKYGYELSHADLSAVEYEFGTGKEQCAKISENLGINPEEMFTMSVLGRWRSLVKPPTYNPRTALADAVFPVLGKEKALSIISGKFRRSELQKDNFVSCIRNTIENTQASSIASMLGVQHISSQTGDLTIKQVLEVWDASLKSEPLKEIQREELCKRLDDRGFGILSSKLRHGGHQHIMNGDVLMEMVNAIMYGVAYRLAGTLGLKLGKKKKRLGITDVLEEWADKIRKHPLKEQECIVLSNQLIKNEYSDFALEIMTGFVPKTVNPDQKSALSSALEIMPAIYAFQNTFL